MFLEGNATIPQLSDSRVMRKSSVLHRIPHIVHAPLEHRRPLEAWLHVHLLSCAHILHYESSTITALSTITICTITAQYTTILEEIIVQSKRVR